MAESTSVKSFKKVRIKTFFAISVLIVLLATIPRLCYWLSAEEISTSTLEKYFTFDSKTILEDLSQGKYDVFAPTTTLSEMEWWAGDTPNWSQADYLHVAGALNHFAWNESLDDFEINYMDFTLNCEDVNVGFREGRFGFFKIVYENGEKKRIERKMEIVPSANSIAVWENTYYPYLVNWKKIDKSKFTISANEALQIAEGSGGEEQRTRVQNDCLLYVSLHPASAQYKGWHVVYQTVSGRDFNRIFTLWVDPYTGKIK